VENTSGLKVHRQVKIQIREKKKTEGPVFLTGREKKNIVGEKPLVKEKKHQMGENVRTPLSNLEKEKKPTKREKKPRAVGLTKKQPRVGVVNTKGHTLAKPVPNEKGCHRVNRGGNKTHSPLKK